MENHGKIMEFDSGKALGTLHMTVLWPIYLLNRVRPIDFMGSHYIIIFSIHKGSTLTSALPRQK